MEKNEKIRYLIVILVCLVGLYYFGYFSLNSDNQTLSPQPRQYVELSIILTSSSSGEWYRGEDDLPHFRALFDYAVHNEGNILADDTMINSYQDEQLLESWTEDIAAGSRYTDTITNIKLLYDTTSSVKIEATYQNQIKTETSTFTAELPRDQSADVRLFITPNDPEIIELRNRIVRYKLLHRYQILLLLVTNTIISLDLHSHLSLTSLFLDLVTNNQLRQIGWDHIHIRYYYQPNSVMPSNELVYISQCDFGVQ